MRIKQSFILLAHRVSVKKVFPIPQRIMPAVTTRNVGVIYGDKLNFENTSSKLSNMLLPHSSCVAYSSVFASFRCKNYCNNARLE